MTDALVDRYAGVVLDVDGVLMHGRRAVPGAAEALTDLGARGIGVALATNNASRSPAELAEWLAGAGVAADAAMIATSAQAAGRMMRGGEKVFVIGLAALRAELELAGATLVEEYHEADTVVVGIDPQVCYPTLRDAAFALAAGARFVATNLDPNLPADDGPRPGNGAIVAALRVATGREPEVAGKPGPEVIRAAIAALGVSGPVLVCGDRIDTDVVAGSRAGCDTALILTGATSAETAAGADPAPTWVLDDLGELLRPPPA